MHKQHLWGILGHSGAQNGDSGPVTMVAAEAAVVVAVTGPMVWGNLALLLSEPVPAVSTQIVTLA